MNTGGAYFRRARYAAVAGETGILNAAWPVGDVRRYGVTPDGVTDWETAYSARMQAVYANSCLDGVTVTWPPGLYATGMNIPSAYSGSKMHFEVGAEFGSIVHLISSAAPTPRAITTIVRAANVATVTTSVAHGFISGEVKRIVGVLGGTSDFNAEDVTITVTGATTFTYANTGANEAGSVVATQAYALEKALRNLRWTGTLTTYDRFGTINLIDSYIERVHVKSDLVKHTIYPGTKSRGIHIYFGTARLTSEEWLVDDCGNLNNTDAALAIDGSAFNPVDLRVKKIRIRKSDTHGAYITGFGHQFGELQVDEFAASTYGGTGLQDADNLAQSQEQKGVWINRAVCDIGVLRIGQSITEARASAMYHLLVDETGVSTVNTSRPRSVNIGHAYFTNVNAGGVSFGDRNYLSPGQLHVNIDKAEVLLAASAVLTAGYQLVSVQKNTGETYVRIGYLALLNQVAQPGVKTALGSIFAFDVLDSRPTVDAGTNNGSVLEALGRVVGGAIRWAGAGGSMGATPVVYFNGAGASASSVRELHLVMNAAANTQAVKLATVSRVQLGKIYSALCRSTTACVELATVDNCRIEAMHLTGAAVTGIGVLFNGVTDCTFGNVNVSDFATGCKKGAGAITRSVVINGYVQANTVDTDVPAASFSVVRHTGVQL